MQEPEKYEFCSDAWLACATTILSDLMKNFGPSIAGETFSVNEIFSDPPVHLCLEGRQEVYWGFSIHNGESSAGRSLIDTPNVTIRADYNAALPRARKIYADRPPSQANSDPQGPSPAMQKILRELHNRLARLTA